MTKREIKHLYHRFGFGLVPSELKKLEGLSRSQITSDLFKRSEVITHPTMDFSFLPDSNTKLKGEAKKTLRDHLKESSRKLNQEWISQMNTTTAVLREKMTLFWHGHFACMTRNGLYDFKQNSTIRENALGTFRELLLAVSKSAGMINYLNNKQNTVKAPNENFARELMELFTIGRDNYSELDIKEAARAFTGWNHTPKGEFKLKAKKHDFGEKTFFGQTGNWGGEDIIDFLLKDKKTSVFIATKLYTYFVSEASDKSRINEIAEILFENDYKIDSAVSHIISSDWFYQDHIIGTKIKSPIELIIGLNKHCFLQYEDLKSGLALQRMLGQVLLAPPNVAGWPGGKRWIDSSTLLFRMKLASVMLNDGLIEWSEKGDMAEDLLMSSKSKRKQVEKVQRKTQKRFKIEPDLDKIKSEYGTSSNDELIEYLISVNLSESAKLILSKSDDTLTGKLSAVMSLPEFQLC